MVVQEVDRHACADLDADEVVDAIRQAVAEEHEVELQAVVLIRPGTSRRRRAARSSASACRAAFLAGSLPRSAEWREPPRSRTASASKRPPPPRARSRDITGWLVARLARESGIDARRDRPRPALRLVRPGLGAGADAGRRPGDLARAPPRRPSCSGTTRRSRRSPATSASNASRLEPDRHRRHRLPLPGAPDPAAFWRCCADGVDAISEVPPDRWDVDELLRPGRLAARQDEHPLGRVPRARRRLRCRVLRHLAARGGLHGPAAAAAAGGRLGGAGGRGPAARAAAPGSQTGVFVGHLDLRLRPRCSSRGRPASRRLRRHRQRAQHRRQPALLPASTSAARAWPSTPPARRRWSPSTWPARASGSGECDAGAGRRREPDPLAGR